MRAQFKQIMSKTKGVHIIHHWLSFYKKILPCVQYHPLVLLLALLGLWQLLIPYTNTPHSVCKVCNILLDYVQSTIDYAVHCLCIEQTTHISIL